MRDPARRPCTNIGWHDYYVRRFNQRQHPDAAHLAMFFLLLHLRDDT